MKIKSFSFFREYYELITFLKKEEQKDLLLKIIMFVFEDEEVVNLNENQMKIWNNVGKPIKTYKTNALNGLKGGRPKTQNKTQSETETITQNETEKESTINMSMSMSNVYVNVIDYLNDKTNSNFKHTTEATQKLINGRFADGFTEEDFKKVIDKKVLEWTGTEFEKHLNPSTLFRPSNFEKYLNQKITTSETPDWFDKKIEKQEVDETKRKEVEDLLKEFK